MSKHWYQPTARNFDCNDHPKQSKQLAEELAEHTGLSIGNARHVIDRLRHLRHCIGESENITLFRLQPGKNQVVQNRPDYLDEL